MDHYKGVVDMTEVLLYHHVQGLTDGVRSFADELRQAGHTVHTPDLFDGRTFDTIEEGMGFAREGGLGAAAGRRALRRAAAGARVAGGSGGGVPSPAGAAGARWRNAGSPLPRASAPTSSTG